MFSQTSQVISYVCPPQQTAAQQTPGDRIQIATLSTTMNPSAKPGLELNKEITTSADQIAQVKTMESPSPIPPAFVEHVVPQDENQKGLCTKERMICLEFTSREFHAGQIEDEFKPLNDINGCSSGCCLNEPKFLLTTAMHPKP